jgi:putative ABC transport system substrate-binding protein
MRPRWWTAFVVLVLLAANGAGAEPGTKPARIGVLTTSFGLSPHAAGLRDGLAALGYRENEDFVLGVRFAEGDVTALQRAVNELIWTGSNVIFATGANPTLAAQHMTKRIPIVFAGVADPVGLGLVERLEQPGGNVTGVADRDIEVGARRLEILRDLVPGMKRVLYVHDGSDPYSLALAKVYRDAGRQLGLEVLDRPVRSEKEADTAFAQIGRADVHGIIGPAYTSFNLAGHVLDAARRRRLPTVGSTAFWAEVGGLVSYGADLHETGRQAARLVDRILRGESPAQIPVQSPTKIELSVNVETARTLGLPIAPHMLDNVDRIFR